jgi:hypothetical protein
VGFFDYRGKVFFLVGIGRHEVVRSRTRSTEDKSIHPRGCGNQAGQTALCPFSLIGQFASDFIREIKSRKHR